MIYNDHQHGRIIYFDDVSIHKLISKKTKFQTLLEEIPVNTPEMISKVIGKGSDIKVDFDGKLANVIPAYHDFIYGIQLDKNHENKEIDDEIWITFGTCDNYHGFNNPKIVFKLVPGYIFPLNLNLEHEFFYLKANIPCSIRLRTYLITAMKVFLRGTNHIWLNDMLHSFM